MWDHCGVCLFFYCHACELANAFILYFMVNYSFTHQHLAGVFYFMSVWLLMVADRWLSKLYL